MGIKEKIHEHIYDATRENLGVVKTTQESGLSRFKKQKEDIAYANNVTFIKVSYIQQVADPTTLDINSFLINDFNPKQESVITANGNFSDVLLPYENILYSTYITGSKSGYTININLVNTYLRIYADDEIVFDSFQTENGNYTAYVSRTSAHYLRILVYSDVGGTFTISGDWGSLINGFSTGSIGQINPPVLESVQSYLSDDSTIVFNPKWSYDGDPIDGFNVIVGQIIYVGQISSANGTEVRLKGQNVNLLYEGMTIIIDNTEYKLQSFSLDSVNNETVLELDNTVSSYDSLIVFGKVYNPVEYIKYKSGVTSYSTTKKVPYNPFYSLIINNNFIDIDSNSDPVGWSFITNGVTYQKRVRKDIAKGGIIVDIVSGTGDLSIEQSVTIPSGYSEFILSANIESISGNVNVQLEFETTLGTVRSSQVVTSSGSVSMRAYNVGSDSISKIRVKINAAGTGQVVVNNVYFGTLGANLIKDGSFESFFTVTKFKKWYIDTTLLDGDYEIKPEYNGTSIEAKIILNQPGEVRLIQDVDVPVGVSSLQVQVNCTAIATSGSGGIVLIRDDGYIDNYFFTTPGIQQATFNIPAGTKPIAIGISLSGSPGDKANFDDILATIVSWNNVLLNPGFENWTGGLPDNWSFDGTHTYTISQDTTYIGLGSYSLHIGWNVGTIVDKKAGSYIANLTENYVVLKQNITANLGNEIYFSANFTNMSNIDKIKLSIMCKNGNSIRIYTDQFVPVSNTDTWVTIINIDNGYIPYEMHLTFYGSTINGAKDIYIDDLYLSGNSQNTNITIDNNSFEELEIGKIDQFGISINNIIQYNADPVLYSTPFGSGVLKTEIVLTKTGTIGELDVVYNTSVESGHEILFNVYVGEFNGNVIGRVGFLSVSKTNADLTHIEFFDISSTGINTFFYKVPYGYVLSQTILRTVSSVPDGTGYIIWDNVELYDTDISYTYYFKINAISRFGVSVGSNELIGSIYLPFFENQVFGYYENISLFRGNIVLNFPQQMGNLIKEFYGGFTITRKTVGYTTPGFDDMMMDNSVDPKIQKNDFIINDLSGQIYRVTSADKYSIELDRVHDFNNGDTMTVIRTVSSVSPNNSLPIDFSSATLSTIDMYIGYLDIWDRFYIEKIDTVQIPISQPTINSTNISRDIYQLSGTGIFDKAVTSIETRYAEEKGKVPVVVHSITDDTGLYEKAVVEIAENTNGTNLVRREVNFIDNGLFRTIEPLVFEHTDSSKQYYIRAKFVGNDIETGWSNWIAVSAYSGTLAEITSSVVSISSLELNAIIDISSYDTTNVKDIYWYFSTSDFTSAQLVAISPANIKRVVIPYEAGTYNIYAKAVGFGGEFSPNYSVNLLGSVTLSPTNVSGFIDEIYTKSIEAMVELGFTNYNRSFVELFDNTSYIDLGQTTCSIDTNQKIATGNAGDQLVSTNIFFDDGAGVTDVNRVSIVVNYEGSVNLYVSKDDGANWTFINEFADVDLTGTPDTRLRYKVVFNSANTKVYYVGIFFNI